MIRNAVKWKLKCLESLKHLIKAQIAHKCQTCSHSVGALRLVFLCLFKPLISARVSIFPSGQTLVDCVRVRRWERQHNFYWPIKRFPCNVLTQQITPAEGYSLIRITLHLVLHTHTHTHTHKNALTLNIKYIKQQHTEPWFNDENSRISAFQMLLMLVILFYSVFPTQNCSYIQFPPPPKNFSFFLMYLFIYLCIHSII